MELLSPAELEGSCSVHTHMCSFCSALHSSLTLPVGGEVTDRKEWARGLVAAMGENGRAFSC